MARKKIDEGELRAIIQQEISASENYAASELTPDRERAIEYYKGIVSDVPAMDGRSKYTSKDVSAVIGQALPGLMRIFTASDQIVKYEPEEPGDEDGAKQASDYINYCFMRDNPGYQILYDAEWDSLTNKDAIVKQYWDKKKRVRNYFHTGVTEEQIAVLMFDEDKRTKTEEIERSDPYEEQLQVGIDEMGQPVYEPVTLYDIKIKRTTEQGRLCYETLAPENFLVNEDALDLKTNWRFQAERAINVTRSDLISMGFSRDRVDAIASFSVIDTSPEEMARRSLTSGFVSVGDRSMERVDLYECYIKMDVDNDGMAEVVRVMYAGNASGAEILDWEEWEDETPYSKIPCNPIPHRFESESIADDTMDVMKFKTVVGRQMIDNLYLSNLPQPEVEANTVLNIDALVNPGLGVPIFRTKGATPINWNVTPFIADKALLVMGHFDQVLKMRTGLSSESLSLDADTLQNQSATASNNMKDAAYSKTELISRNQSEYGGWKDVFAKSLRIIVKNQDRPRTIRLRDEWVEMDPRAWNADMDAIVDVGLGTGSRERDVMIMQQVNGLQKEMAITFAQGGMTREAIELIPKITKSAQKIAEAAGLRNSSDYFPDFDEQRVQELIDQAEQMKGQPSPEEKAAQAKIDADMQVKQADMQMKAQQSQQQMQLDVQKTQADNQLEIQKMNMEFQLKREQLAAELELKRQQLNAELAMAQQQWEAEFQLQKEQAAAGLHIKAQEAEARAKSSNVRPGGKPG
jgi:hypothetical protein